MLGRKIRPKPIGKRSDCVCQNAFSVTEMGSLIRQGTHIGPEVIVKNHALALVGTQRSEYPVGLAKVFPSPR
jgi:hypothetical protein